MFFNSLHFGAFFLIVFAVATPLRGRVAARNAFLLAASYYFYGCWDWRFLSLILISTVVDYACGLALHVSESDVNRPVVRTRRDRAVLMVSLATNLGLLGFFKYFDFFVASAADMLSRAGVSVHLPSLQIILPVGVSFYTFQTLSYTIDVYRGRIATERSLLNFALFVAFFPQLVAGPIERASRLLPQFREKRPFSWPQLYGGFYLICWGLFKKVVIADQISSVVDVWFGSESPSRAVVVLGSYAFAIQIYCDFSGYSDIARGAARCLGFDLMLNFNLPYFATNPSDFWRRWHISLSTWLRDYLYIPLGGSKGGSGRTYVNLMLTMVLGGLWHGAAWTFVAWGFYQGALLCIHRVMGPFFASLPSAKNWIVLGAWYWLRVVVFFQFVCFGWLLFRAESMGQVWSMTKAMWFGAVGERHVMRLDDLLIFLACGVLFFGVQLVQRISGDLMFVIRLPVPIRALVYAFGILVFVFLGSDGEQAFIYFQF
jgi:alginate O-acetyltransferase complex protein AlgI